MSGPKLVAYSGVDILLIYFLLQTVSRIYNTLSNAVKMEMKNMFMFYISKFFVVLQNKVSFPVLGKLQSEFFLFNFLFKSILIWFIFKDYLKKLNFGFSCCFVSGQ